MAIQARPLFSLCMTPTLTIPIIASLSPAFAAGCWEPTTNSALGRIQTGAEEILVGDLVCELGSLEQTTYRAACMDDRGTAFFISVTENGDTALVVQDEGAPALFRQCAE